MWQKFLNLKTGRKAIVVAAVIIALTVLVSIFR